MLNLKTPCFIVNEEELRSNINNLHKALQATWGNYIIGYSCKTNSLPWILNFYKLNNCYLEVVSSTEYKLAKKIGYSIDNIVFNGPNKEKESFIEALKNNCIVNIDSKKEIEWLKEEEFTSEIKVGIRINFNLEKECPGETEFGDEGSRFGFSVEKGELEKSIDEINSIKNVKVVGIHLHNGTKTRSLNVYKTLAKKACDLKKLFKYDLEYVDLGGGFYGGLEDKPSYYDYMRLIEQELSKEFDKEKTKLIIEPGTALIASPVDFLCEVVDVKDNFKGRIVTVNGSRNDIDPLFVKRRYFYEISTKYTSKINIQTVCGYTCMEKDRIMKIEAKEELSVGDRILFNKVGSYTMCLSPLFIEYFPRVYLKDLKGNYKCIREPWGIEEYLQKSYI